MSKRDDAVGCIFIMVGIILLGLIFGWWNPKPCPPSQPAAPVMPKADEESGK